MKRLISIIFILIAVNVFSQVRYDPSDYQVVRYYPADTSVVLEAYILSVTTHKPIGDLIMMFRVSLDFRDSHPAGSIFNYIKERMKNKKCIKLWRAK